MALTFPCFDFVTGQRIPATSRVAVALRYNQGQVDPKSIQKQTPNGMKRQMMKRMPRTTFDTEEMMKRITTVLIKNIDEKWRDAPMKTADIMKEIGLQGFQIKKKSYINKALYMLMGQHVIHKVKQNPIRWEIHEAYRKQGVPPISTDPLNPWRNTHLLKFEKTKPPKYGPIHGKKPDKWPRKGPFYNFDAFTKKYEGSK